MHEDFGLWETNFLSYRALHLAPRTNYVLRARVWRDKDGVAQIGIHDKFTKQYVGLMTCRTPDDAWGQAEMKFTTKDQGWLRIYVYNRSKGGQKVRFRDIQVRPQ